MALTWANIVHSGHQVAFHKVMEVIKMNTLITENMNLRNRTVPEPKERVCP